ncbi:hypothetical protein G6L16_008805 [Agrobacterium tumefaciens]|nr:hypothetical protein [Agrobacterium tumefaciens]NSZ63437.1 hypothetical protein [Agrobacterium tumefaciens]NTA69807.1 hypothetical protein [Agrobacterium tumefaciens]WIE36953.1 hypothetical protein G6L16_008805 [Agrobacterium tumefaciens]
MDEAWIEGANAAYDGKSRSANPYSSAHGFLEKTFGMKAGFMPLSE